MNTRLKQFLSAENISPAHFAETMKIVRASVSHILSGRNRPGYDFIQSLMINYPQLNIEWLILGEGKMYRNLPTSPVLPSEPEPEADLLPFPSEDDISLPEPEPDQSEPLSIEMNESGNLSQLIANQRKVHKIIILFDDGSFQEMK